MSIPISFLKKPHLLNYSCKDKRFFLFLPVKARTLFAAKKNNSRKKQKPQ